MTAGARRRTPRDPCAPSASPADRKRTARSVAVGDVRYAVRTCGDGPPLVLLHGYTGSSALWTALAAQLAPNFRCIAIDLLGHGDSSAPPDPARYAMAATLTDLAGLFDALGLERAALLGYSMGGRVALAFAIEHPQRVTALLLEGASPGLADAGERAARASADAALAARITRDGTDAFIDTWMAQPLFASQARLDADTRARARRQRAANSALGLAASLRGLGSGAQPSYWHRLHELTMPVLLLAGADDAKFQALARAMARRIADATLQPIAAAGHATHLEQPAAFAHAVEAFLAQRLQRSARRPINVDARPPPTEASTAMRPTTASATEE